MDPMDILNRGDITLKGSVIQVIWKGYIIVVGMLRLKIDPALFLPKKTPVIVLDASGPLMKGLGRRLVTDALASGRNGWVRVRTFSNRSLSLSAQVFLLLGTLCSTW